MVPDRASAARFVRLPGLSEYTRVHALQQRLLDERLEGGPDVVLLLEHEPVFTVGRKRGAAANLLAPRAPVVEVERGGDVTWHGPGQLVAYPIVKLEGTRRDLHSHLRALEDAVLQVLRGLMLDPCRDARNTGVWLPMPEGRPRKVCSIGIAARSWVTWHGLALNVCPDLSWFDQIRPCGYSSDIVTRLSDHRTPGPTVEEMERPLAMALATSLGLDFDGHLDTGPP